MTATDNASELDQPHAAREAQIAEQAQQVREILESCPAALIVMDEEGRLLFHNPRLREMFGYAEEELALFGTRGFWRDLGQRTRIIEILRERGGGLLNEVVWRTKQGDPVHVLLSYVQSAYRGGHVSFAGGSPGYTTSPRSSGRRRRAGEANSASGRRSRASPRASSATTPTTGWWSATRAIARRSIPGST